MAQWCADIRDGTGKRFSQPTGARYKKLWRRWGSLSVTDRPSFAEAVEQDVGKTLGEVQEAASVRYVTIDAAPETRREVFRQLAADSAVVEEASEVGSPVSRAISGLEHRAERVREERRERMAAADPVMRHHEQESAIADLMGVCDRYARDSERVAKEIGDLLRRGGPITEDRLFWVRQAADRLRAVLDVLDGYAAAGKSDLDTFLGDVLSGGGRGQSHG